LNTFSAIFVPIGATEVVGAPAMFAAPSEGVPRPNLFDAAVFIAASQID